MKVKNRVKEKLKKLIEENPRFGFSRIYVIRYVPVSERSEVRTERDRERRRLAPRIIPPPPPVPTLTSNSSSSDSPPPIPNHLRRRRRNAIIAPP